MGHRDCAVRGLMEQCARRWVSQRTQGEQRGRRKGSAGRRGGRRDVEMTGELDMAMDHGGDLGEISMSPHRPTDQTSRRNLVRQSLTGVIGISTPGCDSNERNGP